MPVGKDVIYEIQKHVTHALQKQPEIFDFGVSMIVMPGPQGPQPGIALYISTSGAQVGTSVYAVGIVSPYGATEDKVAEQVNVLCEQVLQARSAQIAQSPETVLDTPNPSGLVVPGAGVR